VPVNTADASAVRKMIRNDIVCSTALQQTRNALILLIVP
jgi:hypothetical protein